MSKLLLLLFFAGVIQAHADEGMAGKVISVTDGNTLVVAATADGELYTVVLEGIDSPELTQAYGDKAKSFLEKLLLKKTVTVHFRGKDRKGNYVAVVLKGDTDVRVELLKEGLAWTAEKDPLPALEAYVKEAQKKGKGLWKEADPTAPWIYRREQSMMQPKSS